MYSMKKTNPSFFNQTATLRYHVIPYLGHFVIADIFDNQIVPGTTKYMRENAEQACNTMNERWRAALQVNTNRHYPFSNN
jgi:hypothetical protein